jgi:hypothetical protein
MDARIKQVIMEMLRMGEDPDIIQKSIEDAYTYLRSVKTYQPNHDLADFYRAYKDADFRP